ncbi:hypothetical protein QYH69_27295 [Paraburkholderia sp. SARCC-3016]|uniref:hypothetical protein n=1 Tax=Paraburkholderia sp. SARCC-3016 TaxID=3058611 RepID=UPI002806E04B|nr:hypothetical protein [Paraburkholderia sp. SARCC-3016]MDQ7980946.1 hypothetical protein [Paraburkholderia sp. SARCC-3016]
MKHQIARMRADFRANPFAHGLILLVPAIQYGLNYFASVSALLFVALALNTRMRITPLTTGILVIATSLSLLWNTIYLPEMPNMPREARLAVGMLLLAWGLNGQPRHNIAKFNGWWPLLMLLALTGLALLQSIATRKGIALFVPTRFFVNSNDNALASAWAQHAAEHGLDFSIRSTATFSEPSYLGGVSLFLNFLCLHLLRGRPRLAASVVALAACLISQTMFGLVANLAVMGAFYHRHINKSVMICLAALGLAALALPVFAAEPSRIERILSGNDVSTGLRIFQPFEILGHILFEAPFGVPETAALEYFIRHGMAQRFEDAPFQNGVFNMLFNYGWLGFAVIGMLLRVAGGGICALFLLLLFCQSGVTADFDKLVMVIFAVHVARQVRATTDLHELTRLTEPRLYDAGNRHAVPTPSVQNS